MHTWLKLALFGLALVAATALVTSGILNAATPQEKKPSPEEIMKKYMELGKPGEPHQGLAKCCGDWNVTTKFFMGPDQTQESTGTANFEMMLGGRFLVQKSHGSMNGIPYESFQVLGYDNVTKQYQSVYLDNWSTGVYSSTGKADDKGCVKMAGVMKDAMTPNGRAFRTAWTSHGDDKFTLDLWETHGGKEVKTMEQVFMRKQ